MEGATNLVTTVLENVPAAVSTGIETITGNPVLAIFLGFGVVIGAMKVFKSAKKSAK